MKKFIVTLIIFSSCANEDKQTNNDDSFTREKSNEINLNLTTINDPHNQNTEQLKGSSKVENDTNSNNNLAKPQNNLPNEKNNSNEPSNQQLVDYTSDISENNNIIKPSEQLKGSNKVENDINSNNNVTKPQNNLPNEKNDSNKPSKQQNSTSDVSEINVIQPNNPDKDNTRAEQTKGENKNKPLTNGNSNKKKFNKDESFKVSMEDIDLNSIQFPETTTRNLIGLNNVGNTCYMNSSLQMLMEIFSSTKNGAKVFFESSLIDINQNDLDKINKLVPKRNLTNDEESLYQEISSKAMPVLLFRIAKYLLIENKMPPKSLMHVFTNTIETLKGPQWFSRKQQDAHEFIEFILHKYQYDSLTFNTFIQLDTNDEYGNVIYRSKKEEKSMILSLNINGKTLEECLDYNFQSENLSAEKTKKNILSNESLPKLLILHLRRFGFLSRGVKNERKINSPDKIDLSKYTDNPDKQALYEKKVIISHAGSINSGHYTTYVKSNGEFFHINDSNVSLNIKDDIDKNSYIILYQKIG